MLKSDRERCRIDRRDVDRLSPQERPLWPWLILALLVALLWFMLKADAAEKDYGCTTITLGPVLGRIDMHFGHPQYLTRCVTIDGRKLPKDARWTVSVRPGHFQ